MSSRVVSPRRGRNFRWRSLRFATAQCCASLMQAGSHTIVHIGEHHVHRVALGLKMHKVVCIAVILLAGLSLRSKRCIALPHMLVSHLHTGMCQTVKFRWREDPFTKGKVLITGSSKSRRELRLMQATFLTAIERRRRPPRKRWIFKPQIFHTERRDFQLELSSLSIGSSK